jgi:hypothetical protein
MDALNCLCSSGVRTSPSLGAGAAGVAELGDAGVEAAGALAGTVTERTGFFAAVGVASGDLFT